MTAICSAAGIPTEMIFFRVFQWIFRQRILTRMQLVVRRRLTDTKTAEMHWEMTVAQATPATPIRNFSTRTRSSTVLITAQITR